MGYEYVGTDYDWPILIVVILWFFAWTYLGREGEE